MTFGNRVGTLGRALASAAFLAWSAPGMAQEAASCTGEQQAACALRDAQLQSERIVACRALTGRSPDQAYDYARSWTQAATNLQAALPAHQCAARALIGMGRPREAAGIFEEAASALAERSLRAAAVEWRNASRSWAVAGQPDRAAAALDAAIERIGTPARPDGPAPLDGQALADLRLDRAAVRAMLGNWAPALDDAEAAMAIAQSGGPAALLREAQLMRARIYRNLRVTNLADEDIQALLARSPSDVDARLERALLRRQMGDEGGARTDFGLIVQTAPATPAGQLARRNLQAGEPQ